MATEPLRQEFHDRAEPRDEVYCRARATLADQRSVPVTVVNLSPGGMMARAEVDIAVGEWVKVQLPVVGMVTAAVRWSLGGRIGCQFDRPIDARRYGQLLAATTS